MYTAARSGTWVPSGVAGAGFVFALGGIGLGLGCLVKWSLLLRQAATATQRAGLLSRRRWGYGALQMIFPPQGLCQHDFYGSRWQGENPTGG